MSYLARAEFAARYVADKYKGITGGFADTDPYRRYLLQGGFALGMERFLTGVVSQTSAVNFPNYENRINPWPTLGTGGSRVSENRIEVPLRIPYRRGIIIDTGDIQFGQQRDSRGQLRRFKATYGTDGVSNSTLTVFLETIVPSGVTINVQVLPQASEYVEFPYPNQEIPLDVVSLQRLQANRFRLVREFHPGATSTLVHGIVMEDKIDPYIAFEVIEFEKPNMDIRIRQVEQMRCT